MNFNDSLGFYQETGPTGGRIGSGKSGDSESSFNSEHVGGGHLRWNLQERRHILSVSFCFSFLEMFKFRAYVMEYNEIN